MSLLRVENLSCHIPSARGIVRAVDDVSLTLDPGQVLGIVGESGCGKSTLVGAIAGIAPGRVTGRVRLDDTELLALRPAELRRVVGRRIGLVFQDPSTALNPVVPIGRQVTEAMRHHLRLSPEAARARAIDLLGQVGVPDPAGRLGHYPHQFSGGLRQRITIAMALSCDPELLIADEATTALDVTVARQILDLLARLAADRGMAMILVSHDLGVVAGRTDRTAVMYAGRIVEYGPTAPLFGRPRHRYTQSLLAAIPRLDGVPHAPLRVVPGAPPDLAEPMHGCAFRPRCAHAEPDCAAAPPPLTAAGHACLHPGGE